MTAASAEDIAAAAAEVKTRYAAGEAGRFVADVDGVTVVGLGLPERWATAVVGMPTAPSESAAVAALQWCADRDDAAELVVRQQDASPYAVLQEVDRLPVFVTSLPVRFTVPQVPDWTVRPAATAAEFRTVYAAAFGMRPGMAESLVVDADLQVDGLAHLVAEVDGAVVAGAILREGGGLGYVNGVSVAPDVQRRGYGTAMLGACAEAAARRGCRALWLHAAADARAFYERLGFDLVDTHVSLALP